MLEVIKIVFLGPIMDMKKTPGTSLSVLFVWGVIAYAGLVLLPKLARAADVQTQAVTIEEFKRTAQSVQSSVAALDTRLRYDGMRRALAQLDDDIYDINREIQRSATPSDFLLNRQRQLQARRAEIQEKVAALLRQNPDLVYQ